MSGKSSTKTTFKNSKKQKFVERKQKQHEHEKIRKKSLQTSSVRHGRETANPNATTSVIADTAAPANGGYIFKLATTPQPSVAKAIP